MDVLNVISKYMSGKYIRFEDGEIWLGKERIHFSFLPISVKEFLMNEEINGSAYAATMFLLAKKVGYDYVDKHAIPLVKNWTPVVKMGLEWLDLTGVGQYKLAKADNKKGFGVATGKSAFGLEVKSERPGMDKPADFSTGGLLAGSVQYYVKRPMYAVETMCVAQKGVQECVFVIGDRKDIIDYIRKFSPDKLDLANNTLDQIEEAEKQIKEGKYEKWVV